MRIEISNQNICGTSALDYFSNMESYLKQTEGLISTFKIVKSSTCSLPGGADTLLPTLDEVDARIQQEENAYQNAKNVQAKSNDFLSLACQVDQRVSISIKKNQENFYKNYPLLAPASYKDKDKKWHEKAWAWLCNTGKSIVEGAKATWEGFTDTVKKAWNGLVNFYEKHQKIIDTIFIIVGAIAAIAAVVSTGGAALVPLLGAVFGIGGATATAISTFIACVAVTSTILSSTTNLIDVWFEVDNQTFNSFQKIFNYTSFATNALYSIGGFYNNIKGVSNAELSTLKDMKASEIKTVVKQDSSIKAYEKLISKTGSGNNNNIANCNYVEMKQDQLMRQQGYKWYDSSKIKPITDFTSSRGRGIDGMYVNNKGSLVIGEAKYNTSQLGNAKYGKQMSDSWISKHLDSNFPPETVDDIIKNGYVRVLTKFDPISNSFIQSTLDKNANIIGLFQP